MPDDRDQRKPKTAPFGVTVLDAPAEDDLTPVNAPSFVLIGKISERVKEIGNKLDASIKRDEDAHESLRQGLVATNDKLGALGLTVAAADGKLDILIGDRQHLQKLEQIETIAETKLTVIEKRAELEDVNDKRATYRKIGLRVMQIIGAIVTMAAGGFLGAGLHGC